MSKPLAHLVLTGPVQSDENFIHSTWASSYRVSEAAGCRAMPTEAYHPWHRTIRGMILGRPSTRIMVARDGTNSDFIYGYIVAERLGDDLCVHWIYVKSAFKRQRVASRLLAAALEQLGEGATGLVTTHRTYMERKAEDLGFRFVKLADLYRAHIRERAEQQSEAST